MAGDDDRIAERLKEVEEGDTNGGMSVEESATPDDEITIGSENIEESVVDDEAEAEDDADSDETDDDPAPVTEISTSEILQSDTASEKDEMSVAERLGTAADFEKRAAKLRRKAIEETEDRLAQCFDQTVDVELNPQSDGTLLGEIRIPGLVDDLDEALDEKTNVAVEHISVAVGNLEEESNEET